MTIYIKSGIPFFYWYLWLNYWGYSEENTEENTEEIKQHGSYLGIVTETERFMFYLHNENNKLKIQPYLINNNNKIHINKFIIVYYEEGKVFPYYVNECNFKYIGI